jgi:hypothetical protein
VVGVKLIRDKTTFQPVGYGFVEFNSHEAAMSFYKHYNGERIPGILVFSYFSSEIIFELFVAVIMSNLTAFPQKRYRLNWAAFGSNEARLNFLL